jgi:RNA polymerase sigma-70 factor, ECF subfamily
VGFNKKKDEFMEINNIAQTPVGADVSPPAPIYRPPQISVLNRQSASMVPATETIWEEFNIGLKRFILKHVQDEPSAEDILQDVFLKVHTHIGSLRESDKLQGWIYQIARNAITDYYRTHKFTPDLSEEAFVPEDPFDDVVSDLLPFVKKLVDSLPHDYRQALLLTEYEGLTQRQLSERLGISISGAKSRVQRAREKVKQMLLNCCHFEFDVLGRIIDYEPNCDCCVNQDCTTGCK